MGSIKRAKHGPEWFLQRGWIEFLTYRGWNVERLIGNALQTGIPDLFAMHRYYGQRWIDIKNPKSYSFTVAQRKKWPEWESFNVGIWILTDVTQAEYDKLFGPPNWRDYWKPSFELPDLQGEIDAVANQAESLAVPFYGVRHRGGDGRTSVPTPTRPRRE